MILTSRAARRALWAGVAALWACAGGAQAVTFTFQPSAPGSVDPAPGTEFYHFTAPTSGVYALVAAGGAGGFGYGPDGGLGMVLKADFHFQSGQALTILTGSMGQSATAADPYDFFTYRAGGGGGGTFVVDSSGHPLLVAGGGGGGGNGVGYNADALPGPDGGQGLDIFGNPWQPGGHDGSGGLSTPTDNIGLSIAAAGGGGFYGDGQNSDRYYRIPGDWVWGQGGGGGQAFVNGGAGGAAGMQIDFNHSIYYSPRGGYGGGGSAGTDLGGGGGGYSGGSVGQDIGGPVGGPGGGGGSFVAPGATGVQYLQGYTCNLDPNGLPLDCTYYGNPGDGYFSIDLLRADGVPEPGVWALMLTGLGLVGAAARRNRRRPEASPAR